MCSVSPTFIKPCIPCILVFPSSAIYVDSRNKKVVCVEFNSTTVCCVNRKTSHLTVTLQGQKNKFQMLKKFQCVLINVNGFCRYNFHIDSTLCHFFDFASCLLDICYLKHLGFVRLMVDFITITLTLSFVVVVSVIVSASYSRVPCSNYFPCRPFLPPSFPLLPPLLSGIIF